MDKYALLSLLAPVAAPAAPATVLINTLYTGMVHMGVEHYTALGTSVLSGVGAELSGMIAAYATIQAYRRGAFGHFWVALCAFSLYVLFMGIGIATGSNPLPLVVTVLISIIAYLAAAVLEDLFRGQKETTQAVAGETGLLKARAGLLRAEARVMEAGSLPMSNPVHVDAHGGRYTLAPGQEQRIHAYWLANPLASLRQVAAACECSPTTAGKYKPSCTPDGKPAEAPDVADSL